MLDSINPAWLGTGPAMARAVPIEEVSMIKLVLRTLLAAGGIAAAAVVGAAPIT